MKVSVIIPSHKGAPVDLCVESVKASTFKDIEIIVVDEGLERSRQRNIGIDRAKGQYLLFLDSDMTIHPRLIQNCLNICEGDMLQFDAIYIPEIIIGNSLLNFERQFYTETAVDVVRFVKKRCCVYFDETMHGPEDSDWQRRLRGCPDIAKADRPLYHHLENLTFWQYFKKKAYYSKSMARFAEKWPDDKVLDWKWRCFGVFFERGGWKRVLKRPDLMFLVWCLIFMRGIVYLCVRKS